MMATATALNTFFNGFSLPAYPVNTVPDGVDVPYITFYISQPDWLDKSSGYAQVWYRTKSNTVVYSKADEIVQAIGYGKILELPSNKGFVVIYPESPKVQLLIDGDTRAAVINFSINSYSMPGV